MPPIYLDHAATTPLASEVAEAMRPCFEGEFGNASSRHPLGVRAAARLEDARASVARALCADARRVVFTSGGTEAGNLAVLGIARAAKSLGRHVVVGATEHACIRESAAQLAREGFEVEHARLTRDGSLDLEHLAQRLRADTVLVAQMLVNNEFGTLYPVRRVAKLARARSPRARLLVDAVQALGKLDCSLEELGADCVTLSAHKIHGPKGAGALVLASDFALEPLFHGGGQERGLRSGTENVAAIVGLAAAVESAEKQRVSTHAHLTRLRARLCERFRAGAGLSLLEPGDARVPSIVSVLVPGAPAEVYLHHLEAHGVYVSAGSACQAPKRELSPALRALGMSDEASRHVLRISFGRTTTDAEIERAADALLEVARKLEAVTR